jgi:hypothetical protein
LKKLALLGGVGALAVLVLGRAPIQAADHLDGPTIRMSQNAMADISDVYAWMTSDAAKVNLALTVSPADPGTNHFNDSVQYVFHVQSHAGFQTPGIETKIICTFQSDTNGQCWVVDPDGRVIDYVSGDLSGSTGRESRSGKLRVFAGRRSDPFFFNLSGFRTAVATVKAAGTLQKDAAGCPTFANATVPSTLRSQLQAVPNNTTDNGPCPQGERDCFLDFNVMAIVVQVDKDELLRDNHKLVSVWASTHAAP